jgi:hypothetical protein
MGSHRRLFQRFLLRELAKAFQEAFRDREKAELVARGNYTLLNISRGEVLKDPRYVNPSLQKAFKTLKTKTRKRGKP